MTVCDRTVCIDIEPYGDFVRFYIYDVWYVFLVSSEGSGE